MKVTQLNWSQKHAATSISGINGRALVDSTINPIMFQNQSSNWRTDTCRGKSTPNQFHLAEQRPRRRNQPYCSHPNKPTRYYGNSAPRNWFAQCHIIKSTNHAGATLLSSRVISLSLAHASPQWGFDIAWSLPQPTSRHDVSGLRSSLPRFEFPKLIVERGKRCLLRRSFSM